MDLFIGNSPEIYDWSKFRNSEQRKEILLEWDSLLLNKNAKEKDFHKFLFTYPALFLADIESYLVVSKLKLGSDYETDFVIIKEGYSEGAIYEVIEIESPHTELFTKAGVPSAKFNSSLQQIRDWKRWLKANKSALKKIFPAISSNMLFESRLKFKIVIGRRSTNLEVLEKRRQIAEQENIEIISFDRLTDLATYRNYLNEALIPAAQFESIPYYKKNRLANPFYTCTLDSDWRNICKNGYVHIYTNLIDDILNSRAHNDRFEKFIDEYKS